jgi:hypothetical protein
MNIKRIARSAAGILAGLFLISTLVEVLEFGLVNSLRTEPITGPDAYYAIRNRGWFLALKLVYNTAAAIAGGFVAALIAGYALVRHGLALAIIQTMAFAWALSQPEMRQWTPLWMWFALMTLSFGGILLGARLRAARSEST